MDPSWIGDGAGAGKRILRPRPCAEARGRGAAERTQEGEALSKVLASFGEVQEISLAPES